MTSHNPLSDCAAPLFSHTATRCGKGDAALAAGRPLLGCPGLQSAGSKATENSGLHFFEEHP